MTTSPLRVSVVNDFALVVAGVAGLLRPYADRITIVEEVSREQPRAAADIVLYDTFGQRQGRDVNRAAAAPDPASRLVIYSWNTSADLVEQALSAGAAGYLSKDLDGKALADALERIHAGEMVVMSTPDVAGEDVEGAGETASEMAGDVPGGGPGGLPGRWPGRDVGLSPREAEVLALLCQGLSNEEISRRAFIGVNTVKTYLRTMFRKIDVTSRTQAVLWGIDHGFRPDHLRRTDDTTAQA
ncbi:response regulator transcription factor [Nocardioides bruguierae]|uniref:response regulator transcription factor n=1 Tax=Nocardioides bruguierae TaxID=2945102 RepID=UPI002021613B|nr:response regulator transcription factor [Nocardioides bruguierae]MCL8026972.1 response regulator transcription factor [Nocardioides bruguierae]